MTKRTRGIENADLNGNLPSRRALGVFHFNVQYIAGDENVAHRYCSQAVEPFLRLAEAFPEWCLSMEIAGTGLEFLQQHYPELIIRIRKLTERGSIELISATYVPTLWLAFPKRDLVQSIELNIECLRRLGLVPAKIFFAQEAFFGTGLASVADYFDAFLCKDELLRYYSGKSLPMPAYRMAGKAVVVGRNHLIHALAHEFTKPEIPLQDRYRGRLAACIKSLPAPVERTTESAGNSDDPFWFHMGSGHHITTSSTPSDMAQFFYDPAWAGMNIHCMKRIAESGMRLSSIGGYIGTLGVSELPELGHVIEGGWNTINSDGVYAWMGRHRNRWEDNPGILGLVWRSRMEVRRCEDALALIPAVNRLELKDQIDEMWKAQIVAEASDPHGWVPYPVEVNYGRRCAEAALQTAIKLRLKVETMGLARMPLIFEEADPNQTLLDVNSVAEPVGVAQVAWSIGPCGYHVCDVFVTPDDGLNGIRFNVVGESVHYSPTGLEERVVRIDIPLCAERSTYLPLANGLVGIGQDRWVIRSNMHGLPAARVCSDTNSVSFCVHGFSASKKYQWQFLLVNGTAERAIDIANHLNRV
jgi:hypothetical protein